MEDNGTVVLLVEDDADIRDSVSRLLARRGYRIETASDGQEAVEAVKEGVRKPDIILMDLRLPRMNGWDAIAAIRSYAGRTLPIIVLTGDTSQEDRDRAMAAGADTFLMKPLRIQPLCEAIDALLRPQAEKES